jgi:glycerol-3-phosphate dehydrogenase
MVNENRCDTFENKLTILIGQQNDARMNVTLALTAAQHGATIANHCEVVQLIKNKNGHIKGAKVRDTLTGDELEIKAKVIIKCGTSRKIQN